MERIKSVEEATEIARARYNPNNNSGVDVTCGDAYDIEGKTFYPVNVKPPIMDSMMKVIAANGAVIEVHFPCGDVDMATLDLYNAAEAEQA